MCTAVQTTVQWLFKETCWRGCRGNIIVYFWSTINSAEVGCNKFTLGRTYYFAIIKTVLFLSHSYFDIMLSVDTGFRKDWVQADMSLSYQCLHSILSTYLAVTLWLVEDVDSWQCVHSASLSMLLVHLFIVPLLMTIFSHLMLHYCIAVLLHVQTLSVDKQQSAWFTSCWWMWMLARNIILILTQLCPVFTEQLISRIRANMFVILPNAFWTFVRINE